MLPIVKLCKNRNVLGVYTRVNVHKHSSVFRLTGQTVPKCEKSIEVGKNRYVLDSFGMHINRSETPSCCVVNDEVVACVNLNPGDEITI
jgi:hypothetical protein